MQTRTIAPVFLALTLVAGCATATARKHAAVPVVVAQDGGWVEVDGARAPAPTVVRLDDPRRSHTITVGAPGHAPMAVRLAPEFRWRTLWAPLLTGFDLVSGHAWAVPERQVEVDLGLRAWTHRPDRAPYLSSDAYRRARARRNLGIGLTVAGTVVSVIGYGLMMSAVCYEECDDAMGTRLGGGLALSTVGSAAMITGAVLWVQSALRRGRIERDFAATPRWP